MLDENLILLTMFKVDLTTNSLPPKTYNIFFKNNKKGKRLYELNEWKKDYISGETTKLPRELIVLKKELEINGDK